MTTRQPDASPSPPPDPAFDAAWRATSSEAPPAALDAAILAAARRAVDAGPRRVPEATRPERWWWPLAAAATIGAVAVGILQVMPDRPVALDGEPAIVSDMPAAPPSRPALGQSAAPAAPAAEMRTRDSAADAGVGRGKAAATRDALTTSAATGPSPAREAPPAPAGERQTKPRVESDAPAPRPASDGRAAPERGAAETANAFPAAPAPTGATPVQEAPAALPAAAAPAAPPPAPATAKSAAAETMPATADAAAPPRLAQPFPAGPAEPRPARPDATARREMAGGATAPSPAAGKLAAEPAPDAAPAARAQQRPPLPVADWIALIRKLRAEGRVDEAARELAAFRRAHPDHLRLLPEDLRDWRPVAD